MYNRLTLEQLMNLNTKFFSNLKNLYKKERIFYFKDFIKDILKEGNDIIYFESNQPTFRIINLNNFFRLIDEKEKIELNLDIDGMNKLHNFLKDDKKINKVCVNNKTILEDLIDKYNMGNFSNILGKPFLVYDIETIGNINDLRTMKFMMAYCIDSIGYESLNFKYVDESSLTKFSKFLLDFDGYIVGYNNIYFDNPVVGYNVGWDQDKINILKEKSLDLFLFIWNLTKRRLGLNSVSSSLLGLGKTLESGLEGENLLKQYLSNGDKKLLTKVKNYCKNDVKMTLGLLLYILEYKKLCIDDSIFEFDDQHFVSLAQRERTSKEKETFVDSGMF